AFPNEINLVKREYGTGLYKTATYFITKSIAELPLFVFGSMIFLSITYFMIGLKDTLEAFLLACIVVNLGSLTAVWLGYTISIIAGDSTMALSVAGPILVPLVLFSGMGINLEDIPDYFQWMKEISWFKNAYQLMMINQWKDYGSIPCPNASHIPINATIPEMCAAISCPYSSGQVILDYNSMEVKPS
ncbi:ATP-binding cassette sub-family g member, partial [Plakobranchus ocellatus]